MLRDWEVVWLAACVLVAFSACSGCAPTQRNLVPAPDDGFDWVGDAEVRGQSRSRTSSTLKIPTERGLLQVRFTNQGIRGLGVSWTGRYISYLRATVDGTSYAVTLWIVDRADGSMRPVREFTRDAGPAARDPSARDETALAHFTWWIGDETVCLFQGSPDKVIQLDLAGRTVRAVPLRVPRPFTVSSVRSSPSSMAVPISYQTRVGSQVGLLDIDSGVVTHVGNGWSPCWAGSIQRLVWTTGTHLTVWDRTASTRRTYTPRGFPRDGWVQTVWWSPRSSICVLEGGVRGWPRPYSAVGIWDVGTDVVKDTQLMLGPGALFAPL